MDADDAFSSCGQRLYYDSLLAEQFFFAGGGLPTARTQYQTHQENGNQGERQCYGQGYEKAYAETGQGGAYQDMAPSNMETIPPATRTPWLVYLASMMKKARAKRIRKTPAKFTGRKCMA